MKRALVSALPLDIASCVACVGPSAAAVTYTFEGGFGDFHGGLVHAGDFSFVSPDFITRDRIVPLADLASCSTALPESDCVDQQFYRLPDRDLVDFRIHQRGFNDVNIPFRFDPGAFVTLGLHLTPPDNGYVGRLTVAGFAEPSSAPEPAAWALLILGFGGVGSALRGRRRPARIDAAG